MSAENDAQPKGAGVWGQVITALALVGALGAALLIFRHTQAKDSAAPPPAATCSDGKSAKPTGAEGEKAPYLSGAQLCELLYRSDLAELLGTPGETAQSTTTSGSAPPADGASLSGPYAQVSFPTWTVNLAATYHNLPMAEEVKVFGADAQQRQVLGHPAFSYSDHTIEIRFHLGSGGSQSGAGAPATVLSVAMDPKGTGGSFEVTLWRTDGSFPPDDATLLRVAETILPAIPGWTATV